MIVASNQNSNNFTLRHGMQMEIDSLLLLEIFLTIENQSTVSKNECRIPSE